MLHSKLTRLAVVCVAGLMIPVLAVAKNGVAHHITKHHPVKTSVVHHAAGKKLTHKKVVKHLTTKTKKHVALHAHRATAKAK